jgi:WD40-like Beta Propeller Repeat
MRTVAAVTRTSVVALALTAACESQPPSVALALEGMSFANSEWSEPVNLGAPINSEFTEQNSALTTDGRNGTNANGPELSSDGRTLTFFSTRSGGVGGFDIWMSTRTPNGH